MSSPDLEPEHGSAPGIDPVSAEVRGLRLPNLVIVGPGKAGTTSLFWYLSQHPDICASSVKETQFLLPLAQGRELPPIEDYTRYFDRCAGERYRLEASPQYLHASTPVINGMRELLPAVKTMTILRDPIDRVWSTYRFMRSRLADLPADLDFDGYVDRCRQVWERDEPLSEENRLYWTIQGGFYRPYVQAWHQAFGRDFKVVFFERLAESPRALVIDVCTWLGIDTAATSAFTYSVENRTAIHRSRTLQRIALVMNREGLLGNRRRLKEPLRRAYYRINQRRDLERMSTETRSELDAIFAPGNRELARYLTELGQRDLPDWLSRALP